MGKKRKINRMISKWIKSDLPDDRSSVLLLGVAKIPTSPESSPRGVRLSPVVQSVAPPENQVPCRTVVKKKFVVTPCDDGLVAKPSLLSAAVAMDPTEPTDCRAAEPSATTRLPSYLSLACTVNGYSATTNYDPDRLARSRDTSPHRPLGHCDGLTSAYTVCNNLLSPPNLVPLPPIAKRSAVGGDMAENGAITVSPQANTFRTSHDYRHHHHHQLSATFNSYNVSVTSGSVDVEGGFKSAAAVEKANKENDGKSFIQQRIERLYGPGALAQGFFVMKKQKSKSYEIEHIVRNGRTISERHSQSMNEQALLHDDDVTDNGMKQRSPSLPVLRHLRPEFRAQLPITVSKKQQHTSAQNKVGQTSVVIPILLEEETVNEHEMNCGFIDDPAKKNGTDSNKKKGNDICDKTKPRSQRHGSVVKDGHYFMVVLEEEVQRLLALSAKAEEELESADLSEDAKGFLRSASGKARLLVSQKMQQFKGLCQNNLTQLAGEAFPTTNEDLQGFWDMIMLQVHQIDDLFSEIEILRKNNWQEEVIIPTPSGIINGKSGSTRKPVKVTARPVSPVTEENRRMREIQRKKMIEEKRRAMKEQQQKNKTPRQSIEIYIPESS